MRVLKTHWPLIGAIVVLWAALAVALTTSGQATGGRLIYALDDPYIHMSVAKNFAEYGVWGVTRYEFSSSTSSMLWPLLLALDYTVFGVNEASAFTLNVLFGTLMLAVAYGFLRVSGLKQPVLMLLALLGVVFFTPLPALAFIGMEHTLHAFVLLLFIVVSAREIAQPRPRGLAWMGLLSFVVCLTRYESAFAVLIVGLLLFARRRFVAGLVVGAMGLAPIVGYGLISLGQGWFFLPNSLYLRGPGVDTEMKILQVLRTIFTVPDFSLLLIVGGLLVARRVGRFTWTAPTAALIVFCTVAAIHLAVARTGWFYRYEAYLVAIGFVVIVAGFAEHPPRLTGRIQAVFVSLTLTLSAAGLLALGIRGANSYREIPRAVKNIYEQQYCFCARSIRAAGWRPTTSARLTSWPTSATWTSTAWGAGRCWRRKTKAITTMLRSAG
jgi:hypothetical protein